MIRKILSIALLCGLSMSALAMTCPPKSAFTHVPGQVWKLNDKYKAQGWIQDWEISGKDANTEFVKNTQLTKLDNRSSISINMNPNDFYTVSCFYTLPGDPATTPNIAVVTRMPVDEDNIHMPPYVHQRGIYFCTVTEKVSCAFPTKSYPPMKEPLILK
jgi:hypothetical protein